MIRSMTGFAEQHGATDDVSWTWTLRSVNGKGFDLKLRTPPGFEGAETLIRRAKLPIHRGTIMATLKTDRGDAASALRLDEDALAEAVSIVARARRTSKKKGLKLKRPRADRILAMSGVLTSGSEAEAPDDGLLRAVATSFARGAQALADARGTEGRALADVLADQLETIETLTTEAERLSVGATHALRQRLAGQVAELLGGDLPQDRIAQEAAMLAVRADVREETDRLRAHAAAGRALLAENGPVGRKFEFLAQELAREANTLTAKAPTTDMKQAGLDLKHVVDQLREQVLNVE